MTEEDLIAMKTPDDLKIPDALSGDNLNHLLHTGASVAKAGEALATGSAMGMTASASKIANVAAVAIITSLFIAAFMWLRSDAMAERADFRAQVLRAEAMNEERRREDRQDRQKTEEMFARVIDTISKDNKETVMQMKMNGEQLRIASEQMKAATDAIIRVEKLLTAKQP